MGFLDSMFGGGGGYGQHNPEYRRQAEDLMNRMFMGQMIQDNPDLQQYFSTPEGVNALQKMGLDSTGGLGGISGLPSQEEYEALSGDVGGMFASAGDIVRGLDGEIDYSPEAYDQYADMGSLEDVSRDLYGQAQTMQEEAAQRGFGRALAQLSKQMGAKGFGPAGMAQAGGTSLGRNLMQQFSDIGRQMALTSAQEAQKAKMFDLQRKQQEKQFAAQFGEGQKRFGSQLQQYAKNFGLQKAGQLGALGAQQAGTMGGMFGARTQRALQPYTLGSQYFGSTAGLTGPKARPGIFGQVAGGLGALAEGAGKAYGSGMFG